MQLQKLAKTTRKRKRIGRGYYGGHYSGKGLNGQKARSGVSRAHTFEGGRTPLARQLPKIKGMKSLQRNRAEVNLGDLKNFTAKTTVDVAALRAAGLVPNRTRYVKILAEGDVAQALTVRVQAISAEAKKKLEAAGGKFHPIITPSKLTKKQQKKRDQATKA